MKKIKKPASHLSGLSVSQKAELALKAAVKKTMAEHKKRGEPVAIWKDGKAIWLPADEIKT
jgi:hypothetical protein